MDNAKIGDSGATTGSTGEMGHGGARPGGGALPVSEAALSRSEAALLRCRGCAGTLAKLVDVAQMFNWISPLLALGRIGAGQGYGFAVPYCSLGGPPLVLGYLRQSGVKVHLGTVAIARTPNECQALLFVVPKWHAKRCWQALERVGVFMFNAPPNF